MMSVCELIEKDKEIDIRLPALENETIHLDVPPSKVYLNIKGKGSNRRQISSTNVLKELRDPQSFPHRCMILVGLPGVGKTTSLFRIKEEHKSALKNKKNDSNNTPSKICHLDFEKVEDIEILIYQPLRNNEHKSLNELLHCRFSPVTDKMIPHSRQLQHILLHRKTPSVLLLDAIDESTAASDELIRNIWKIKDDFPNLYIIFTTRGSASNALRECVGDDNYDSMCVNVTGLDPSEFLDNARKLIDAILDDRRGRERNPKERKREALSNLQKIKQKFPPVGTNPLLLTIAVRLVLDPFMRTGDHLDNLNSMTQLLKGMMESLKRRLCDYKEINEDAVDKYLDFLGSMSLNMLQQNKFTLNPEYTEELRGEIKRLGIFKEDIVERVLQSFLSKKEENIFQHLHAVTQSFLAAKSLHKKLMALKKTCNSDLKLEMNNQLKGIPKEHQQTVLILLVGILHELEEDDVLNEIASNICDYFDLPQYNYFDNLKATKLHLFQESYAGGYGKPNDILERDVIKNLPDSLYISEEALEAFKYIMAKEKSENWPKEITITIESNPDHVLNLIPVLDELNKRNSYISLELCQSSQTLVRDLPNNIERLMVHWKFGEAVKMLEAFNTRLPNLHKMNWFHMYLWEEGSLPKVELPEFFYGGNVLILEITASFSDTYIPEVARIAAWAFNHRPNHVNGLTLNSSKLSGSGCAKLIDELSRLDVKAVWLCVDDAQLAEGEREQLQIKAKKIGIRIFVPPGLPIMRRGRGGKTLSAAMNDFITQPIFVMDMIENVIDVLSDKDHNMTAANEYLVKEFTSLGNPASATSDQLQSPDYSNLDTSLHDDFIGSVSEVILQCISLDPGRFNRLLRTGLGALSNNHVMSSDFGGHIKDIILRVGKKFMEENPEVGAKIIMASVFNSGTTDSTAHQDALSLPQLISALFTTATPVTPANENITREVKQEEDFDLD